MWHYQLEEKETSEADEPVSISTVQTVEVYTEGAKAEMVGAPSAAATVDCVEAAVLA